MSSYTENVITFISEMTVKSRPSSGVKFIIRPIGIAFTLFFLSIICFGNLLYAEEAPVGKLKRVLLLNSYHKGYLWTDEITRGVEETLAESSVELHIEYMDTKRQFNAAHQNLLNQMLSLKHHKHHYDVIISSDDNAFNFLKEWGKQIFGNIPVVFCGVNYLKNVDIEGLSNYTGVNEQMDIAGNLALIRQLHPDRKKVVVITDNTTTGKENQKEVHRVAALTDSGVQQIELVYNVSIDELRKKMQILDDQTVVLFTIFIRDKNEIFLGYDQGMKLVCENTAVPVYATQNFKPGLGVIGGYLTSGYDQGAVAANKAKDILSGKPVSEISICWDTPTRPRFDYRHLQRHGISLDLLPSGSEILHQPVSFYYHHKTLIWNTAIAFCLLLLALLGVGYGLVRSRQAERKLRRNEENLRTTLNSIGDAVIATDTEGKIVRMNPVAEQLTGWRFVKAQGKPIIEVFNIVHSKTHETVSNPVEKALSTGEIVGLANHTVLISKDRTEYQIADSAAPIRDDDGKTTGVVLVFRDVTEEYRMRESLRESEAKFRGLVESSSDWIWEVNAMGVYTYASPKVEEMLGYNPEDVVGKTPFDLMPPGEKEQIAGIFQDLIERGRPIVALENVNLHENGQRIVIETSAVPILDATTGNVIGYRGVDRDITERKRAQEALKESEKKYRRIYDNILDVYYETNIDGIILEVSPSIEKYSQYKREELIGKSIYDVYTNPEERNKFIEAIINDGRVNEYELNFSDKDDTQHICSINSMLIKDKNGNPIKIVGIMRDISDRKKAEKEKMGLEEKLLRSQKMESLGLLAGGVAHDLNNVLSGIVSYPELILMDLPEDSKFRKPIETIQESGHRAAAIVNDLLTVARGVATTKEPLNLNDLVGDYLHSPEFNKLKHFYPIVTVKTNLDTNLLNINGSYVHIRKVVMNLVSNASEAIEGSGNVTISTTNRYIDRPLRGYDDVNIGEYVVLSVSDDGSGISSDDLERIFEPFYTKKVMGRSGTGLGLAVVWNTVQDHKGYIDVASDENGTTFELYFPITRDEISDKDLSIPMKDYKGNQETILVVDDEESQRKISCKMLETLGYQTKAVSSGEEAVEYLKENTVDLLLLDMIMDPGINGRETYERVIKIHPKQKAIIISGFAQTDEVKKAQKLGAGQYIKKPVTLEKIGLAVKEELEK